MAPWGDVGLQARILAQNPGEKVVIWVPFWVNSLNIFAHVFRTCLGKSFRSSFDRFLVDLDLYFETFLRQLVEQADFVKIMLPPTREPQSGGSGDLEKVTFFIAVWHLV